MTQYRVVVVEVHLSHRTIEAENERDALDKVAMGGGKEDLHEYLHDLDREVWSIEKI